MPGKLGCVRAGLGTQRACVTMFCPRDRGGVEGGPGARAGAPGGAELRETASGALTPALLSGTGRGKDSQLRGSRRCQCGWARSGAGVGQLELREAEGAVVAAGATPARVCSAPHAAAGSAFCLPPSLPPPSAVAPPSSVPRGFLQTSPRG